MYKYSNLNLLIAFLIISSSPGIVNAQSGPMPGDIYKEYAVNLNEGKNWRITDPDAKNTGALAFLPNPLLGIVIDDLDGAVKAEVLMDIWSGHAGTSNKRFRFNNNDWIHIPEVPTIALQPECYYAQSNVIMEIPLEYFVHGNNTFEGTSGGQTCFGFNWGQWGWYVMMVRIYYGPDKSHNKASITYPVSNTTITDNPEIIVSPDNPDEVDQVQILGKYFGYDQRGLGHFYDWHWAYHGSVLEGHLGTVNTAPYKTTWNTTWVPDQETRAISFMARVKDKNSVWYVTDIVENISLDRSAGTSIKMYSSIDVPKRFTVRKLGNGDPKIMGCNIEITDLELATEAKFFHRTWNAADDDAARGSITFPLLINGTGYKTFGLNHFFSLSGFNLPISNLVTGPNNISYTSNTSHHGIEVMWPGPAIMVKYSANLVKESPGSHTRRTN